MSNITAQTLNYSIRKLLEDADLTKLTSKKVRLSLENKFKVNLSDRKKEIDGILMKLVEEATSKDDKEDASESSSNADDDSDLESDAEENTKKKSNAVNNSSRNPASRKRSTADTKKGPKSKKLKDSTDSKDEKVKKKTGFNKEMILSGELADLVGADKLSRGDVVKKMYSIIRERDLYDPTNKQFVLADDELHQVFGVKRFRAFGMMKYLKKHIKDPKDLQ